MDLASDRYRAVLSQSIDAPPGARFNCSGGDVALIAAVTARTTRMPIEDYFKLKLFTPLGITKFEQVKDKNGIPIATSGLRLAPRDMMKIGLLMLHHGREGEHQIVPQGSASDATTFKIAVDKDADCGTQYGYFWWLRPGCNAETLKPWFGGIGNGGQRIWIVPSRA